MKPILLLVIFCVFVVTSGDDSVNYHYLDSYFREFKEKNSTLQAQELLRTMEALKNDMRSILFNVRRYANRSDTMNTFRAEMLRLKSAIDDGTAKRPGGYKYAVENHALLLNDSEKLLRTRLLIQNRTVIFEDIDTVLKKAGINNTNLEQDWAKRIDDLLKQKIDLEACANVTDGRCSLNKENATDIFRYIEILRVDIMDIVTNYERDSSMNEYMQKNYIEPLTCKILVYCGLAEKAEQVLNNTRNLIEEMRYIYLNVRKLANETQAMSNFRHVAFSFSWDLKEGRLKYPENYKYVAGNQSLLLDDSEKLLRAQLLTHNRTLTFNDIDAVLEESKLKNTTLEKVWSNYANYLEGIIKKVEPCVNNAEKRCYDKDLSYDLKYIEEKHDDIQGLINNYFNEPSTQELVHDYIIGLHCELVHPCKRK